MRPGRRTVGLRARSTSSSPARRAWTRVDASVGRWGSNPRPTDYESVSMVWGWLRLTPVRRGQSDGCRLAPCRSGCRSLAGGSAARVGTIRLPGPGPSTERAEGTSPTRRPPPPNPHPPRAVGPAPPPHPPPWSAGPASTAAHPPPPPAAPPAHGPDVGHAAPPAPEATAGDTSRPAPRSASARVHAAGAAVPSPSRPTTGHRWP